MNDQLREIWAKPITSYAEYQAAWSASRSTGAFDTYTAGDTVNNVLVPRSGEHIEILRSDQDRWPLCRDAIREWVGVYPDPGNVLAWLRLQGLAGQHFPHISKEDPTMVAFTPDRAMAVADRKVRTTMGKLLRKFLVLASDETIAQLEASHRAYMDPHFEFASTADDIEHVYTTMDGDSGCMRYGRDHFDLEDYHPSAVYSAPGMGVAYIKNGDRITARSVIYDNPDNPTDKRYVRIYGDRALERKLKGKGYRLAGLAGAKIPALVDGAFEVGSGHVVMPYVDSPGGPSGGVYDCNPVAVVRYKGDDALTLIDQGTYDKLRKATGTSFGGIRGQSGYTYVPTIDVSTFEGICSLSGKAFNKLSDTTKEWLKEDGTVGTALTREIDALEDYTNLRRFDTGRDTLEYLLCTEATADKHSIKGHSSYFNDAATCEYLGLALLDIEFYPDGGFVNNSITVTGPGGKPILKTDSFEVVNDEARIEYKHISQMPSFKAHGYTPIRGSKGIKRLVHKTNPHLVQTVGGMRAVIGLSDIVQTWDGQWDYRRNVDEFYVLGMRAGTTQGGSRKVSRAWLESRNSPVAWSVHTATGSRTLAGLQTNVEHRLRKGHNDNSTYYMQGGALASSSYYNKGSIEQIRQAVEWINAADDAALDDKISAYYKRDAVIWANAAAHLLAMYDEQVLYIKYGDAEARALDMNDPEQAAEYNARKALEQAAEQKVASAWGTLGEETHPDDEMLARLMAPAVSPAAAWPGIAPMPPRLAASELMNRIDQIGEAYRNGTYTNAA